MLVEGLREDLLKRIEEIAIKRRSKLPPKEVTPGIEELAGRKRSKAQREDMQLSMMKKQTSENDDPTHTISVGIMGRVGSELGDLDAGLRFVRGDRWRRMRSNGGMYVSEGDKPAPVQPRGLRNLLLRLVRSPVFQGLIALLIIGYSVDIGVHSSLEIEKALEGEKDINFPWKRWTDLAFVIAFTIELTLRITAEQWAFCTGQERYWNIFDAFLVSASFIEIMDVLKFNLAFLRILRAIRSVRVLRVIRIFRFFRELRVMATSIISCLVSLSWAFILLVIVMYIFAVVLLQGATDFLVSTPVVDEELEGQLRADFGNIAVTIYSLMLAVSGGRSWGEYAEPFVAISPGYGVVFMLFIVFVIFGVLNILTGVFVESTHSLANIDKELVIQEEISREEATISQMRALFHEIDVDGSGTITAKELNRNLDDPRVRAYFSVLQMDISEAQGLFQLLDKDESGEVSIEEFIFSCLRLKGNAKSIDMITMLMESKRLYAMVKAHMRHTDHVLAEVRATVDVLL